MRAHGVFIFLDLNRSTQAPGPNLDATNPHVFAATTRFVPIQPTPELPAIGRVAFTGTDVGRRSIRLLCCLS
jgi:hypothetical protein